MPIPNEITFCTTYSGKEVTYGKIRVEKDENNKIDFLKYRLNDFLLSQVDKLIKGSPFPLSVMTCIGIETLGTIFIKKDKKNKSHQFVEIIKIIDPEFSKTFSKEFKKDFNKIWNKNILDHIDNYGQFIYKYFRNTMVHGFQGEGVYLSDETKVSFEIKKGHITLNPYLFWEEYKKTYEDLFNKVLNNEEPYRTNCIKRINKMIS